MRLQLIELTAQLLLKLLEALTLAAAANQGPHGYPEGQEGKKVHGWWHTSYHACLKLCGPVFNLGGIRYNPKPEPRRRGLVQPPCGSLLAALNHR